MNSSDVPRIGDYGVAQDSEVAAVTLAGITLLLAITDDYGPEYFTDDEQAYIIEADEYLSETIKEFYPQ